MLEQEWDIYRSTMKRSLRYAVIAIGISFLFFLVGLPDIPAAERQDAFWFNMLTSLLIAVIITGSFAIIGALQAHWNTKKGTKYRPSDRNAFVIAMFGVSVGLYIGIMVKANRGHLSPDFSGMGITLLGTAFVSMTFIFYRLYQENRGKYRELKSQTVQAQYTALKNQMQPHFLFNSLNSVTELIESDKDNAAKMTQMLSDLYREILENSKASTVSWSSELSIVRKYLNLEKFRFGDRLKFELEMPENADQIFLPSLILQTLVENSIKHGISNAVDGGEVKINIQPDAFGYRIRVTNSGEKFKKKRGGGTGIENSISRLTLLYGSKHGFSIGPDDSGLTVVSFSVSGVQLG